MSERLIVPEALFTILLVINISLMKMNIVLRVATNYLIFQTLSFFLLLPLWFYKDGGNGTVTEFYIWILFAIVFSIPFHVFFAIVQKLSDRRGD